MESKLVLMILLFCMIGEAFSAEADQSTPVLNFYVMGDVPYSADDDVLLPQQVAELPADATFVVHLGDIKRGVVPCFPGIYEKVAGMLRQSRAPVFIIPGDNEWNDCLIPSNAWELWRTHFMRFDQHWQHRLPVFRQLEREENFAFTFDNVLFLGLNLVGGRVHDAEEWRQRHAQNGAWLEANVARCGEKLRAVVIFGHATPKEVHDDFFARVVQSSQQHGKPVLYLHGDGHTWIQDRPFLAKNIMRIQVDQGGKAPPLKVSLTDDPAAPFRFDRRLAKP